MRHLVKERADVARVRATQHGVEYRVIKPAQGRIGRGAANRYVIALAPKVIRVFQCISTRKVTPVVDTTRDRKAPHIRADRKLLGSHHIPRHRIAPGLDIRAVAVGIRQAERLHREDARS